MPSHPVWAFFAPAWNPAQFQCIFADALENFAAFVVRRFVVKKFFKTPGARHACSKVQEARQACRLSGCRKSCCQTSRQGSGQSSGEFNQAQRQG
jgi:hypothetical protein